MIKTCLVCGKEFDTKYKSQVTCSHKCSGKMRQGASRRSQQQWRPVTPTTYLLVELFWREDGYNAGRIAYELKRDVSVVEGIIEDIKRGKYY